MFKKLLVLGFLYSSVPVVASQEASSKDAQLTQDIILESIEKVTPLAGNVILITGKDYLFGSLKGYSHKAKRVGYVEKAMSKSDNGELCYRIAMLLSKDQKDGTLELKDSILAKAFVFASKPTPLELSTFKRAIEDKNAFFDTTQMTCDTEIDAFFKQSTAQKFDDGKDDGKKDTDTE